MILKKSKDSGDYSCDKGNDNALDDTSRSLRYFFMFLGSFLGALIGRIIKAYWFMDEKEKAAVRKLIDGFTEQKK